MSGGISAIKGFDYQATVILDRLLDHFKQRGASAGARPEGGDDLDLFWEEDGVLKRQYIQIKKPTETSSGELNPTPWTLSSMAEKLLGPTIARLVGNQHTQIWIVGDEFEPSVSALIHAGQNAPQTARKVYWQLVHVLSRKKVFSAQPLDRKSAAKLTNWQDSEDNDEDDEAVLTHLDTALAGLVASAVLTQKLAADYSDCVRRIHGQLPAVLARTEILPTYGSEGAIVQRVYKRLMEDYRMTRPMVENQLFRNLRGFINDISKQPGRSFAQEEFELELRSVCPQMILVKEPPQLGEDHVSRRDLAERFTTKWTGNAIDSVGISGAGKTMLAAEVAHCSRTWLPERLVYYIEVRTGDTLRDALSGVAFHLRRHGIPGPFSIAINHTKPELEVLSALAEAYSALPRGLLVLIDLVEGTCSAAFSRELANFLRALSPNSTCRFATFSQESALRELSAFDRTQHQVSSVDIRGFTYEEFVSLVAYHHSFPDRAKLHRLFTKITKGRSAGLFAKLANSLARAASMDEMVKFKVDPSVKTLCRLI